MTMPKARKTDNESTSNPAVEAVIAEAPQVTSDFGREDLNALRDLVNALARKVG